MGIYVNPVSSSKESFLHEHAREISRAQFKTHFQSGNKEDFALALIDNGPFYALGVAYKQGEIEEFSNTSRPCKYYLINKVVLLGSGALEPRDIEFLSR